MKNPNKKRRLVQLELPLEKETADLSVDECRELAEKLERWSHQLKIKVKIMENHASHPWPRSLKFAPRERLHLN